MRSLHPIVHTFDGEISPFFLVLLLMTFLRQSHNAHSFNTRWSRNTRTPDSPEIFLHVHENTASGTVVGFLNQKLSFLQAVAGGGLRYHIYNLGPMLEAESQLLSYPTNQSDYLFQIDADSSAIRVVDSKKLDRERLCPFASRTEMECSLTYGVSVSKRDNSPPLLSSQQSWIRVKFIIQDVNDWTPKFNYDRNQGCKTINLPEDTPIGTKLQLPDAIDLDGFQNSQLNYHLKCDSKPDSQPFALYLSPQTLFPGVTSSIQLHLQHPLDYEQQVSYNCTLTVCDNGTSALCSTMPLCIVVHDVNDNAPVFPDTNSTIILREDIAIGSRVTTINATDADSGNYGQVRFFLVADIQDGLQTTQRHFRVDPITGDVFVIAQLEGGTKFTFWIEARDGGEPESRKSRSAFTIYVIDVNNHAPKITIHPAIIKVRNSVNVLSSVDSVRSILSRVIKVPCGFSGIQDNRVCKEKNQANSLIQVFEDNIAPASIAFVHVSDADVGKNAQIECQLQEKMDVPFGGSIRLVEEHLISSRKLVYKLVLDAMLDCETHTHAKDTSICNSAWTIPLRIVCRDFGSPVRKSYHNIFVEILDNNEFAPVFGQSLYSLRLKENVPIGSNVIQISVTDADGIVQGVTETEGDNLRYLQKQYSKQTTRFVLESKEPLPFSIDRISGRIYTSGELDAESKKKYAFKVKAIDTGVDSVILTSTCEIMITVENVNDNPPRILTPRMVIGNHFLDKRGSVIQIPENLQKGTVFMQLRTEDLDGTSNATLRLQECHLQETRVLSAKKRLQKTVFDVDKETGNCRVTRNLDREAEAAFICVITAEDDSEEKHGMTSTTTVTIELMDENDNSPIWMYPRPPDDSRIRIGVDFPNTRIITRVRAIDADSGVNARVFYSLEEASFVHFNNDISCDLLSIFTLERTSGHLRMAEEIRPCVTAGDIVRLVMRATDGGTPPLSKDVEFFLEFKAGADIANLPAASTFLTQADEAFGNKPPRLEPYTREGSTRHSGVEHDVNGDEKNSTEDAKRIQIFSLMIAVPLGAILLCCCLFTTVFFLIRSSRKRSRSRPRDRGHRDLKGIEVMHIDRSNDCFLSRTDGTASTVASKVTAISNSPSQTQSYMAYYTTDRRNVSSDPSLQSGSEHEFSHTVTGIHVEDATSLQSGDLQLDGKVVYPIYLKSICETPTMSTAQGDAVLRLTSIPELEGTILIPLSTREVGSYTVAGSPINCQRIPEQGVLVSCVAPDVDKSSADSGQGHSDDGVITHEEIRHQNDPLSSECFCVPVSSENLGQVTMQAGISVAIPMNAPLNPASPSSPSHPMVQPSNDTH